MKNVQKFWNLSSPKMCRDFLKNIRVGPPPGARIEFLFDADGNKLSIDEASDSQILQVTNELAEAMKKEKK